MYSKATTPADINDPKLNDATDLVPVYSALVPGRLDLGPAWGVFPAPQTSGGTSLQCPLCHCSESDSGPRCPPVWPTKSQGMKSCDFISKSLVMLGKNPNFLNLSFNQ